MGPGAFSHLMGYVYQHIRGRSVMVDANGSGTRRRWLGLMSGVLGSIGALVTARAAASAPEKKEGHSNDREDHQGHHRAIQETVARQQIMELRHAYGMATDLIGKNTPNEIEAGRAIYRRIFTKDASIGAATVESVTGPDAWVDIVKKALAPYNRTQHLIGTQYITGLTFPDHAGNGGSAHMSSYLQAWHSNAEDDLWLFMGTYEDDLVWTREHGWQIRTMILHQTSADFRRLGKRPA
jgi:hypothetical protein